MAFTWKGTKNADTRTAGVGGEIMYGNSGNDSLTGALAADTMSGGAGNDTLLGGAGGNDKIYGDAGRDSVDGGIGDDKIDGGRDNDTLLGSAGKDTIYGGAGLDSMDGGSENDNMRGDAGNDTMLGGAGADRMDGGTYNDSMEGGAGNDSIYGSFGNDTIKGESAASLDIAGDKNTLYGGVGNDVINGGVLSTNLMYGDDGNDTLVGGGAADTMHGGSGADSFDGGAGADTVSYARSTFGVGINLSTVAQTATFTASTALVNGYSLGTTATGALAANSAGGVVLTGAGQTLSTKGHGFGDTFVAGSVENAIGSVKADWIYGSATANVISGLAGADTINAFDGNDSVYGGDSADKIVASSITDGNDYYDGGAGVDTLDLSLLTTAVTVDLSQGTLVGAGNDTLVSIERVIGGSAADILTGIGSGSTLGGIPNSYLDGGAGNDTLYSATSGSGGVMMIGGLGADTYDGDGDVATDWFGVQTTGGSVDTILGFDELQNDRIMVRLSDIGMGGSLAAATNAVSGATAIVGTGTGIALASYGTVVNAAGTYNLLGLQMASDGVLTTNTGSALVGASVVGAAAHQQFVYNQFDNGLWYDADGSGAGAAVQVATLNATALNLNDGSPSVANVFNSEDFAFINV
jgi:Ca2+-binding RTX toxin-like protein